MARARRTDRRYDGRPLPARSAPPPRRVVDTQIVWLPAVPTTGEPPARTWRAVGGAPLAGIIRSSVATRNQTRRDVGRRWFLADSPWRRSQPTKARMSSSSLAPLGRLTHRRSRQQRSDDHLHAASRQRWRPTRTRTTDLSPHWITPQPIERLIHTARSGTPTVDSAGYTDAVSIAGYLMPSQARARAVDPVTRAATDCTERSDVVPDYGGALMQWHIHDTSA